MGKTYKKSRITEEEEYTDEYINELRKGAADKRKARRIDRALRTKDIEQLMEMDDTTNDPYES